MVLCHSIINIQLTALLSRMATKDSPIREVKYLGMKREIIFNIKAINTLHMAKLFLGWGKSTWPQVGDFQVAIREE